MEFNETFIATILTFIVFVFLMNIILYRPILGIMGKREQFIDENYKNAKNNNSKAEILVNQKEERLTIAKNDARGRYISLLDGFKIEKNNIINNAQNLAKENIEKSTEELNNESNQIKENLKSKITDLASYIVEKILGYRSDIQNFDDNKVNEVLYHQ